MTVLLAFLLLFFMGISLWHFIDLLQFLQQHEYLNGRFFQWSLHHLPRVTRPVEVLAFLLAGFGLLFSGSSGTILPLVSLLVWVACGVFSIYTWWRNRSRVIKPLVVTARVKRLLVAGSVALLIEAGIWFTVITGQSPFSSSIWNTLPVSNYLGILAGWGLISQVTVLQLILANLITWPVEESMRRRYIREARQVIQQVNPVVIGITGSYGKTSTKEILAHLLGSKYEVLKTPRTFNTILGVCKVIREELKPSHKYFIVEMGAYKPGEIAKICELVKPQIGILTAVGPQHLERFKTIEKVAEAKFELIQALPRDGIAIFNGDDGICRELAQRSPVRALRYGVQPQNPRLNLCGVNLAFNENGSQFDMVLDDQPAEPVRMHLLGRHNVSNALAASLAAVECGLSLKLAARFLASMPQLEHRLQVVRPSSGLVTIDNAYNSNPSGAQVALEVLQSFSGERKVLVTPGFAELGEIEAQEHAHLGRSAGQVCDLIFLIGNAERTGQILRGIQETGFDPAKIFCFPTLKEAQPRMAEVLKTGDVVLFENDLTDIY